MKSPALVCIFAPALLLLACGGKPSEPAKSAAPAQLSDVNRYMPLTNNTVYAYDTTSEDSGERGVLMLRVRRTSPERAELGAGSRVQRLELGTDGIRHATGGYLLKSPLQAGSRWKGQFGEVQVTSVQRSISVPAGKYTGCVETVEQATVPVSKKVVTVFCPEVGIVMLDAEGMIGADLSHERAELRSFGPAVDLSVGTPE